MPPHLVLNRNARHLRSASPILAALREAARDTCILHETRSLSELAEVAARVAEASPSAVILAGGDGAYMAGLTALCLARPDAELPPIAFAPGGTVSTVARAHGMRGPLARYARRLVHAVARGDARERTVTTLRVRERSGRTRVGFIVGTGLVVRFFDLYAAEPRPGYAAAARIVAKIFAASLTGGELAARVLAPLPAIATVDGERQPARAYSLIVASTVQDLGLHMRVTYRAGEDPERVHLVASSLGARALGAQLPRVLMGRPLRGRRHVDRLVRTFTIELTGTRRAYVLDGDTFESDAIDVTPGPRVRLLTPR